MEGRSGNINYTFIAGGENIKLYQTSARQQKPCKKRNQCKTQIKKITETNKQAHGRARGGVQCSIVEVGLGLCGLVLQNPTVVRK